MTSACCEARNHIVNPDDHIPSEANGASINSSHKASFLGNRDVSTGTNVSGNILTTDESNFSTASEGSDSSRDSVFKTKLSMSFDWDPSNDAEICEGRIREYPQNH